MSSRVVYSDGLHLTPEGNAVVHQEVVRVFNQAGLSAPEMPYDFPHHSQIDGNNPEKAFQLQCIVWYFVFSLGNSTGNLHKSIFPLFFTTKDSKDLFGDSAVDLYLTPIVWPKRAYSAWNSLSAFVAQVLLVCIALLRIPSPFNWTEIKTRNSILHEWMLLNLSLLANSIILWEVDLMFCTRTAPRVREV